MDEQRLQPYLVHYLRLPGTDKFSLSKAAKMVKDKPVLLFARTKNELRATAVVPREYVKVRSQNKYRENMETRENLPPPPPKKIINK